MDLCSSENLLGSLLSYDDWLEENPNGNSKIDLNSIHFRLNNTNPKDTVNINLAKRRKDTHYEASALSSHAPKNEQNTNLYDNLDSRISLRASNKHVYLNLRARKSRSGRQIQRPNSSHYPANDCQIIDENHTNHPHNNTQTKHNVDDINTRANVAYSNMEGVLNGHVGSGAETAPEGHTMGKVRESVFDSMDVCDNELERMSTVDSISGSRAEEAGYGYYEDKYVQLLEKIRRRGFEPKTLGDVLKSRNKQWAKTQCIHASAKEDFVRHLKMYKNQFKSYNTTADGWVSKDYHETYMNNKLKNKRSGSHTKQEPPQETSEKDERDKRQRQREKSRELLLRGSLNSSAAGSADAFSSRTNSSHVGANGKGRHKQHADQAGRGSVDSEMNKEGLVWSSIIFCPNFRPGGEIVHRYSRRTEKTYNTLYKTIKNGWVHPNLLVCLIRDATHPVRFATPPDQDCYTAIYTGPEISENMNTKVIFGEYTGIVYREDSVPDSLFEYAFELNFTSASWVDAELEYRNDKQYIRDMNGTIFLPNNSKYVLDSSNAFNELSMVNHCQSIGAYGGEYFLQANCEWQQVIFDGWPHVILTNKQGVKIQTGDELIADFGALWFQKVEENCHRQLKRELIQYRLLHSNIKPSVNCDLFRPSGGSNGDIYKSAFASYNGNNSLGSYNNKNGFDSYNCNTAMNSYNGNTAMNSYSNNNSLDWYNTNTNNGLNAYNNKHEYGTDNSLICGNNLASLRNIRNSGANAFGKTGVCGSGSNCVDMLSGPDRERFELLRQELPLDKNLDDLDVCVVNNNTSYVCAICLDEDLNSNPNTSTKKLLQQRAPPHGSTAENGAEAVYRDDEDEDECIVCDGCDRIFHTKCLQDVTSTAMNYIQMDIYGAQFINFNSYIGGENGVNIPNAVDTQGSGGSGPVLNPDKFANGIGGKLDLSLRKWYCMYCRYLCKQIIQHDLNQDFMPLQSCIYVSNTPPPNLDSGSTQDDSTDPVSSDLNSNADSGSTAADANHGVSDDGLNKNDPMDADMDSNVGDCSVSDASGGNQDAVSLNADVINVDAEDSADNAVDSGVNGGVANVVDVSGVADHKSASLDDTSSSNAPNTPANSVDAYSGVNFNAAVSGTAVDGSEQHSVSNASGNPGSVAKKKERAEDEKLLNLNKISNYISKLTNFNLSNSYGDMDLESVSTDGNNEASETTSSVNPTQVGANTLVSGASIKSSNSHSPAVYANGDTLSDNRNGSADVAKTHHSGALGGEYGNNYSNGVVAEYSNNYSSDRAAKYGASDSDAQTGEYVNVDSDASNLKNGDYTDGVEDAQHSGTLTDVTLNCNSSVDYSNGSELGMTASSVDGDKKKRYRMNRRRDRITANRYQKRRKKKVQVVKKKSTLFKGNRPSSLQRIKLVNKPTTLEIAKHLIRQKLLSLNAEGVNIGQIRLFGNYTNYSTNLNKLSSKIKNLFIVNLFNLGLIDDSKLTDRIVPQVENGCSKYVKLDLVQPESAHERLYKGTQQPDSALSATQPHANSILQRYISTNVQHKLVNIRQPPAPSLQPPYDNPQLKRLLEATRQPQYETSNTQVVEGTNLHQLLTNPHAIINTHHFQMNSSQSQNTYSQPQNTYSLPQVGNHQHSSTEAHSRTAYKQSSQNSLQPSATNTHHQLDSANLHLNIAATATATLTATDSAKYNLRQKPENANAHQMGPNENSSGSEAYNQECGPDSGGNQERLGFHFDSDAVQSELNPYSIHTQIQSKFNESQHNTGTPSSGNAYSTKREAEQCHNHGDSNCSSYSRHGVAGDRDCTSPNPKTNSFNRNEYADHYADGKPLETRIGSETNKPGGEGDKPNRETDTSVVGNVVDYLNCRYLAGMWQLEPFAIFGEAVRVCVECNRKCGPKANVYVCRILKRHLGGNFDHPKATNAEQMRELVLIAYEQHVSFLLRLLVLKNVTIDFLVKFALHFLTKPFYRRMHALANPKPAGLLQAGQPMGPNSSAVFTPVKLDPGFRQSLYEAAPAQSSADPKYQPLRGSNLIVAPSTPPSSHSYATRAASAANPNLLSSINAAVASHTPKPSATSHLRSFDSVSGPVTPRNHKPLVAGLNFGAPVMSFNSALLSSAATVTPKATNSNLGFDTVLNTATSVLSQNPNELMTNGNVSSRNYGSELNESLFLNLTPKDPRPQASKPGTASLNVTASNPLNSNAVTPTLNSRGPFVADQAANVPLYSYGSAPNHAASTAHTLNALAASGSLNLTNTLNASNGANTAHLPNAATTPNPTPLSNTSNTLNANDTINGSNTNLAANPNDTHNSTMGLLNMPTAHSSATSLNAISNGGPHTTNSLNASTSAANNQLSDNKLDLSGHADASCFNGGLFNAPSSTTSTNTPASPLYLNSVQNNPLLASGLVKNMLNTDSVPNMNAADPLANTMLNNDPLSNTVPNSERLPGDSRRDRREYYKGYRRDKKTRERLSVQVSEFVRAIAFNMRKVPNGDGPFNFALLETLGGLDRDFVRMVNCGDICSYINDLASYMCFNSDQVPSNIQQILSREELARFSHFRRHLLKEPGFFGNYDKGGYSGSFSDYIDPFPNPQYNEPPSGVESSKRAKDEDDFVPLLGIRPGRSILYRKFSDGYYQGIVSNYGNSSYFKIEYSDGDDELMDPLDLLNELVANLNNIKNVLLQLSSNDIRNYQYLLLLRSHNVNSVAGKDKLDELCSQLRNYMLNQLIHTRLSSKKLKKK